MKTSTDFAIGADGTDTAPEKDALVLVEHDLRKLPLFTRPSRVAGRELAQNTRFAVPIKLVFSARALAGKATTNCGCG